jgi:hypothetical protein
MESTKLLSDVDHDVFVTDVFDDFRYLIMRSVRFAILIGCDVSLVYVGFGIYRSTVICLFMRDLPAAQLAHPTNPYYNLISQSPFGGLIGGMVLFAFLWMLMYAAGMPYRYETDKPGLNARMCHNCRIAIPDELFCPNCKVLRPARLVSWAINMLSAILTGLFAIHDFFSFMLGVYLWGKK